MRSKKGFPLKLCLLAALCFSFSAPLAKAEDPLSVFVSILPQKYFAERIGGSLVEVQSLLPPGQSPATYSINARTLRELSSADAFFPAGVPFEKSLLPKLKTSCPALRIAKPPSPFSEEHDPHFWLSPLLAKEHAKSISLQLSALLPSAKNTFERNYSSLEHDLNRLHKDLLAKLSPYRGRLFLVFHPAYGHFAKAYGLKQLAIEKHGKGASGHHLAHVIELAKKSGAKVILVQPQFSRKSASVVAKEIDAELFLADPLAEDYFHNLRELAQALVNHWNGGVLE